MKTYCMTVKRTFYVDHVFQADNDDDAIDKANQFSAIINPEEDSRADQETDYMLVDSNGEKIVNWD